jgi:hypothetical protein
MKGRTHKVTTLHAKDPHSDYLEGALETIMQILFFLRKKKLLFCN